MKSAYSLDTNKKSIPLSLHPARWLTSGWVLVGLLFILGLASRLPFQSQILYHWDSVNFAFAIQEFDLAKEQPHPPGYIGYVWLARLVDSLIQDAQSSLVSISIVSSALAVVALFYLGQSMFDRRTGLIAALLLATSPLFWFYGEIALPHTLDTLLVIVSVWWLYQTMQGDHRFLYPAIIVSAIAGGIRPQTLVFLAPLILFALRRVGWRRFLIAGLLGGLICLGWFIPLVSLSGGLANYLYLMGKFGNRFQESTSIFMGAGWWGIRRNVIKLVLYTGYGWSFALIPAIFYAFIRLRHREWPQGWEKPIFLLLWIGPALFFYVFIHMGQQGLVFVFLPALLLLSAVGLTRLLAHRLRWLAIGTVGLITLNAAIFCLLPEYPLGPGTQRMLTRDTLLNSDDYYQSRFEAIKANFDPKSTAILATSWHHVEYYLPEYIIIPFSLLIREQNARVPQNDTDPLTYFSLNEVGLQFDAHHQTKFVIFDPELELFNKTPQLSDALFLPNDNKLIYFTLNPQERLYVEGGEFGLISE